jgi:RimJ/RimL family protein N-acetyltransferase
MLVLDQKVRCGDWAKERVGVSSWGDWYESIGWEQDGELIAVCVFTNWNGPDICMHIAAIPGRRWLRRQALQAVFRYAFVQLGVRRITGHVPAKNADAVRFDLNIGFRLEGVKRDGWWDDDMLVLGMLKSECRFL